MSKKLVLTATFGALLIGATYSAAQSKQPIKVAMVLKTLSNPFWVEMQNGIQAEAKKLGVQVTVLAAQSEDDIQGQQRIIEDTVNKDFQGVGIAPLSPVSAVQAVAAANKKGIQIINIDEKIDPGQLKAAGGSVIAFVSTDNVVVGGKGAKFIVSKLGAAGGEVAIIEGKAGAKSGEDRKNGATNAFKKAKGINIVASQPADWDRAKALDVATNIIQRFPNLKAFYCANDTMALGVVQAVKNANKLGKILVVGTDGAPEALASIKAGELNATVGQDAAGIGAKSLNLLVTAIKNKTKANPNMEGKFVAVDSKVIVK